MEQSTVARGSLLKLKKVEIQGFKSFCDRTELRFRGDGIAAVVGPNGCGKSNLSDAISWVLGEQSAKSLRGAPHGRRDLRGHARPEAGRDGFGHDDAARSGRSTEHAEAVTASRDGSRVGERPVSAITRRARSPPRSPSPAVCSAPAIASI